jgi:hypothetical protein
MTVALRALASVLLGVTLCSLVTGCQYAYPFEVSGVVRSAATGKPLAGVKIFSTHPPLDMEPVLLLADKTQAVAVTGEDGRFTFSENVQDIHFMQEGGTRWVVFLAKEGFDREKVDLRTLRRPDSPKGTFTIFLVVCMNEEKAEH